MKKAAFLAITFVCCLIAPLRAQDSSNYNNTNLASDWVGDNGIIPIFVNTSTKQERQWSNNTEQLVQEIYLKPITDWINTMSHVGQIASDDFKNSFFSVNNDDYAPLYSKSDIVECKSGSQILSLKNTDPVAVNDTLYKRMARPVVDTIYNIYSEIEDTSYSMGHNFIVFVNGYGESRVVEATDYFPEHILYYPGYNLEHISKRNLLKLLLFLNGATDLSKSQPVRDQKNGRAFRHNFSVEYPCNIFNDKQSDYSVSSYSYDRLEPICLHPITMYEMGLIPRKRLPYLDDYELTFLTK